MSPNPATNFKLPAAQLSAIFEYLTEEGYQNIGPQLRDGAIMLEVMDSTSSLPTGVHESQGKGTYTLDQTTDNSYFQYTVGPQSFKKYLYPPRRKLWGATKDGGTFCVEEEVQKPPKMAFWGIRGCDIAAIKILDRIFLEGAYVNEWYQQAREDLFILAVGCTTPSANCFCTTSGAGPTPQENFDISLTEIIPGELFVMRCGSDKGAKLATSLNLKKATKADVAKDEELMEAAAGKMPKRFDPQEAATLLKENLEHLQWDDVAKRCLACANCTMVCPTCFCSATEDVTDLTGDHSERWLRWDSCFNADFSYIHGGKIRHSIKSRYRQWMTHKLSSWYDQFGTSGCVGCGRCTTWCPVGIDLTEELLALKS